MAFTFKHIITFTTIALAALFLYSCTGRSTVADVEIPHDQHTVARGRELVKGLAACGFCHGESASPGALLSGGRAFYDSYGEVFAANLTPAATGLADWSYLDIVRALRNAQGKNERELSLAAHDGYAWLADLDLIAIVAYLKSIAAIENRVPRRELGYVDQGKRLLLERNIDQLGFVPAINPRYQQQYGAYLVEHVGRCILCHNSPKTLFGGAEYLAGGSTIKTATGEKIAPAITGATENGLASWSLESIVHYLKSGQTPHGHVVDPQFCPVTFYANAAQSDLVAIAKYLKGLGQTEQ